MAIFDYHLGLAVSGGVDSMALAHLCQEFQRRSRNEGLGLFHFTAFIIDHRSQKSGALAIARTKSRLKQMGMKSKLHPAQPSR